MNKFFQLILFVNGLVAPLYANFQPEQLIKSNSSILLYCLVMFASGLGFLFLRTRWKKTVPLYFYLIHFFIVNWSGLIYLNIYFDTALKPFAWYADWIISTPLIVLALCLSALLYENEKHIDLIACTMGLQAITIITGIFAQIAGSLNGMLTFFALGNIAMLGVFYMIWGPFMNIARKSRKALFEKYKKLALYVIFFWISYPAIWLLSPAGLGIISAELTTILFIVSPIFCKSGFGFLDLYLLDKLSKEKKN